uniref:tRNA-guanine(15) transglycosylase-like domain-containing protein n=1 Tax=Entomoneis paludosa TaxID=265537 RepID=A0A7S2VA37_9STRA|mmetsp:Transcript_10129/g.20923  ORF Transcript_10129/g.20923 Transcript_10129/m.20923 type:complete len:499 (+) Transcript_10129:91-1587(+)
MKRSLFFLQLLHFMTISSGFLPQTRPLLSFHRNALRLFATVDKVSTTNSNSTEAPSATETTNVVAKEPEAESSEAPKTSRRRKQPVVYPPPPEPSEFPDWAFEPRDFFRYELIHQSTKSQARVGRIHTPHGIIDTPGFVAVATNGALKGVDFRDADDAGQQLIFANTYHLLIHPGPDIIEQAGGIHKYTNRNKPFITDSGGFQVFSLAYGSVHEELSSKGELKRASGKKKRYRTETMGEDAVKVTEEGALFRSYRDGNKFLLTPESTVQAQKKIGADIIIPLDELPGYFTDRVDLIDSVDRTHRWEARSLKEHLNNVQQQAMYCVVHGGVDRELRTKSLDYLASLPFDGFGIGGSLGNGRDELKELLTWLMPMFELGDRARKPRHLLGIADEESIRNAVPKGIDTFDSCYPTRIGRHGTVMTRNGLERLISGRHSKSFGVKIDDECTCHTCQHYDRAYLWHLFKANEQIAVSLAAIHNIHYMNDMMKGLRDDIMHDRI